MAEERVVLTAELKDQMSAPLETAAKRVEGFTKTVESGAKRQAAASERASSAITGSVGRQNRLFAGMTGVVGKATTGTARLFQTMRGAITRSLDGVANHATSAGEKAGSGFADGLKRMIGPALALLSAQQLGAFAVRAVESFSLLEDSSAAAGVVFGDSMQKIIDQSKTADSALGLSEQAVINGANTFGTYGKAAGLGGDELAGFATGLTGLAADMASFKGTSTEQALEAIASGLRGEAEPLRAFGVMLDDVQMRDEAMRLGLIKTTKDALTPQQKVMAAQSLIFKQTTDAQGDFARTSTSTANVAKTLSAASENLSAKIGKFLAPAFTAARMKALGAVRGVSAFLDRVTAAQAVLKGGGTNLDIGKALGLSGAPLAMFAETLGAVRAFRAGLAEGGEVTSGGLAGALEWIGIKLHDLKATVAGFGPAQWAGVAGGAALLLASFGKLSPMLSPLLGMFTKFGPILGQLGGSLKFLLGPIGILAGLLIYAYTTNEQFRNSINGVLGQILTLGMTLLTALMPVFTTLITTLLPVIVSLVGQLAPVFLQVVNAVLPLLPMLIAQLVPILMTMITTVLPIVMSLLTTLAPIFMQLIAAVVPLIPPIMSVVSTLLQLAMDVLTPLMPIIVMVAGILTGALGGAISFLMPIIKFLLEAFVNLVSFLRGPLEVALGVVKGIFETLGRIIGGVLDGIGDFMSNPMGGIQDMLGLPKNSGGGVYSGGGVVEHAFAGGGVLSGYSPGNDSILARLSPGESVLVPELTRAIGPQNIMAANAAASGGRPAGSGPSMTSGFSSPGRGGGSVLTISAPVSITVQGGADGVDLAALKAAVNEAFEELVEEHNRRNY